MNDEARTVSVGMGRRQRTLLAAIVGSIDDVGDPADDPAAVRLFPPISQDDSVADDFAEMTRDDLTRLRHTDRTVLDDVLERSSGSSIEMTVAEADACARAVGSARVTMAARLGLFDDPASSVPITNRAAVDFLGFVQDRIVTALLADLPNSERPTSESE